jgi:exodeoxyribonuclease V gamma subunit
MDDDVFPRLDVVDGDDALVRGPMTGERDIRSEDRQLLLDALVSAGETLVITYTGADEQSGRRRPPAVPLAELLDALDQTTESPVRKSILVEHPLQPFDVKNVTPGALNVPTPFTFDPTALTAARAAAGQRREPDPMPEGPLLAPPTGDVELAELTAFFKNPVRGFFRTVEMALPRDVDGIEDAIPVELDNLEQWQVGDRMLGDLLRGRDKRWVLDAEWRRGTMPPGRLGWRLAKDIRDSAEQLADAASVFHTAAARAVDIDVDIGAGRRLTGTVTPVFGEHIVAVTYSKLDGRHLLDSWIRVLALAATDPACDWTAVSVGRGSRDEPIAARALGVPTGGPAAVLADLVAIYDSGSVAPIPLPVKTSYAWAEARIRGRDPEIPAGRRWQSGKFPGEDADPAHVRAWGGPTAPLSALLGPPRPGEEVLGEDTRLGAYAVRLWTPLLRAEKPARRP